jgi:hypothetical protein
MRTEEAAYNRTSRVVYIRQLATLVSSYPPVRVQSACGFSSSSVYDLAQGFAPRPLFVTHRAAPLSLGKGDAPWPSER